jgi:hypothetical protein
MSLEEDTAWLEALAGRTQTSPSDDATMSHAVQDALALRSQLSNPEQDARVSVAVVDASREQQLLERARAEGLLADPAAAAHRRQLRGRLRLWAVAATVIVVIGVGGRSALRPSETLRGTKDGTVRLEADDPLQAKQRLLDELTAAGVRATGYQRFGHAGIDADLPQPLPPRVQGILESHHIPIPKDGTLIVEIDPPSDR